MFNFKKGGGTFKGLAGECMFKSTRNNLFLTRFHTKFKILDYLVPFLNLERSSFLDKNWYSIDAVELINNKVVLFEIKTRNSYKVKLKFKPKTTASTIDLYSKAITLGFTVKIATVWLEEDWNYSIEINDFDARDLCIDKPKKYDRAGYNFKKK